MRYYTIKAFEETGLVNTVITTSENPDWSRESDKALRNYKELGEMFGITPAQMVRTSQVHSAGVRVVTMEQGGDYILNDKTAPNTDGLITNERGLMLCTLEADCVPVFLLDPVKKVVAMVHSGWKGTKGRISENAIKCMTYTFGSNPSDIMAAMGPCICGDDYEVSADLYENFLVTFAREDVESFFEPKENGKYQLYLSRAIRKTLLDAGLKDENIKEPEFCTFHSGIFPSYRKSSGTTDRMLTGIMLK